MICTDYFICCAQDLSDVEAQVEIEEFEAAAAAVAGIDGALARHLHVHDPRGCCDLLHWYLPGTLCTYDSTYDDFVNDVSAVVERARDVAALVSENIDTVYDNNNNNTNNNNNHNNNNNNSSLSRRREIWIRPTVPIPESAKREQAG